MTRVSRHPRPPAWVAENKILTKTSAIKRVPSDCFGKEEFV